MEAICWGADPLFLAMRAGNPSQLLGQSKDYGSMFHAQYMDMKGSGASLDPVKQAVVTRFEAEGTKKNVLRGLLKDILIWSLRKFSLLFLEYSTNSYLRRLRPSEQGHQANAVGRRFR